MLKTSKRGRKLRTYSEEEAKLIFELHSKGLPIYRIAEEIGVSQPTLSKFCRTHELDTSRSRILRTYSEEEKRLISKLHSKGLPLYKIAEKIGVTQAAFRRYCRRNKLDTSQSRLYNLTEDEKTLVLELYHKGLTVNKIKDEVKRGYYKIANYLEEQGLDTGVKRARNVNASRKIEAVFNYLEKQGPVFYTHLKRDLGFDKKYFETFFHVFREEIEFGSSGVNKIIKLTSDPRPITF